MLQSAPSTSQTPIPQGLLMSNPVPIALHLVSVLLLQDTLPGIQAPGVHMPAVALHKASVSQSICFTKLCPSSAQTSSDLPVH
jgi:hypothetical protein